ncbi:MAG TPA: urate hydroxylase PuuD [Candidatus Limnocylindria bacterium]|jgi:uncharacterized membrane protein|nr:urate hydroxylase PuuD [Candidatus Limnocylindria bacterium]
MLAYLLDWANLLVRWTHIIVGIGWIGASFYFVWLDDSLEAPSEADKRNGVYGDLWSVHGGGFYHNIKFLTGPRNEPLTENLHWFFSEAYGTLISGLALLAIVYWSSASTFMIDSSVMALTPPEAIAISIASLVIGWLVYDALCKVFEKRPAVLWTAIGLFLLLMDYGLFHVFGGRAAYIHVGAIIGAIMVLNVYFVVIPGQKKMLAQIRRGETPDGRPGLLGKMRSVHNTYFTLPVLFIMISNHFPMTYGSPYGWIALAMIAVAGVLVRRFMVLGHKGRHLPALPVGAAVLLIGAAILIAPRPQAAAAGGAPVAFAQVAPIMAQRCAVCHGANPTQPGFSAPPAGVLLDTPEHIKANAARIQQQAVDSHAMPLGNATKMTDAERATVAAWIAGGAKLP